MTTCDSKTSLFNAIKSPDMNVLILIGVADALARISSQTISYALHGDWRAGFLWLNPIYNKVI